MMQSKVILELKSKAQYRCFVFFLRESLGSLASLEETGEKQI